MLLGSYFYDIFFKLCCRYLPLSSPPPPSSTFPSLPVIHSVGCEQWTEEISVFKALLPRLLKMTSFTPHPIRKLCVRTGGGLWDDALELAVARIQTCAGKFRAARRRNRYVYNFLTELQVIWKWTSFAPSCAGNGAHRRAEDIRTIVGSWPSQGLAAQAVRIAAGSPAPKFRHFCISR